MINYHETLVSALSEILPTHYEMVLHSGISTPCISYMELNNIATHVGDTVEYSVLDYQIKVWGKDLGALQSYALQIDRALKPLGWKRISCGELSDKESTMIQKIMTYEAIAREEYI